MDKKKEKKIRTSIKAKKIVDKIMDNTKKSKVMQLRDDLTDEEMVLVLRDYLINQRLTLSNGVTLDKIGYKHPEFRKEQDFLSPIDK